jgi:hypothetical protein
MLAEKANIAAYCMQIILLDLINLLIKILIVTNEQRANLFSQNTHVFVLWFMGKTQLQKQFFG